MSRDGSNLSPAARRAVQVAARAGIDRVSMLPPPEQPHVDIGNTVTFTLPWPEKALHAHAKGHWRPKVEATKRARQRAADVADGRGPLSPPVRVSYRFCMPDKRRRDIENLRQACKPYIDGLVDAGVLAGDAWHQLRSGTATAVIDRDNPRVEITLTMEAE